MFTIRPQPLAHVRPDRLCAVEAAGEVDAQVALPQLRALVEELRRVVERARVVDQDVDGAELLDDTLHGRGDLLAVGDVALDRSRPAAQTLDLRRRRLGVDDALLLRGLGEHAVALHGLGRLVRLDLDVRDDDVGARPGERQRVRAPEPAEPPVTSATRPLEVDLDRHAGDPM